MILSVVWSIYTLYSRQLYTVTWRLKTYLSVTDLWLRWVKVTVLGFAKVRRHVRYIRNYVRYFSRRLFAANEWACSLSYRYHFLVSNRFDFRFRLQRSQRSPDLRAGFQLGVILLREMGEEGRGRRERGEWKSQFLPATFNILPLPMFLLLTLWIILEQLYHDPLPDSYLLHCVWSG